MPAPSLDSHGGGGARRVPLGLADKDERLMANSTMPSCSSWLRPELRGVPSESPLNNVIKASKGFTLLHACPYYYISLLLHLLTGTIASESYCSTWVH